MKKNRIITVIIAVLCICIGIGAFQAANSEKDKNNTTQPQSSAADMSGSLSSTESISVKETKSSAASASKGSANKSTSVTATSKQNSSTSTTKPSKVTKNATQNSQHKTTAAKTSTTATAKAEKKEFNVSVIISCKNAVKYGADVPEYILECTSIKVKQGDTAFDALNSACKANNISLKYQSVHYIQGIGGLNEKDCGASSGWVYRVNGVNPKGTAAKYTLSAGDSIEWYYITSPSDR